MLCIRVVCSLLNCKTLIQFSCENYRVLLTEEPLSVLAVILKKMEKVSFNLFSYFSILEKVGF